MVWKSPHYGRIEGPALALELLEPLLMALRADNITFKIFQCPITTVFDLGERKTDYKRALILDRQQHEQSSQPKTPTSRS